MKTPIEVTKFVTDVLQEFNQEQNKKYLIKKALNPTKYSASSAGSCYKKQYLSITPPSLVQPAETEPKSNRIMRLGTIVHQDLEEALDFYKTDKHIETEYFLEIDELNVCGTFDAIIIDDKVGTLVDFKTVGSFPWRLKFGRDAKSTYNRMYSLQMATYAIGCIEKFKLEEINMFLVYYNKDTSVIKTVKVDNSEIDKAKEYWRTLDKTKPQLSGVDFTTATKIDKQRFLDYLDDEFILGVDYGVPFESWECKYCQFNNICKGI